MGMGWSVSSDKWKAPLETSFKAMVVRRLYEEFSGGVASTRIHEPLRGLYSYWPLMQMIRTLLSVRMLPILTYIISRQWSFAGSTRDSRETRPTRGCTTLSENITFPFTPTIFVRARVVVFFVHRGDLSRLRWPKTREVVKYNLSFYVSPILWVKLTWRERERSG